MCSTFLFPVHLNCTQFVSLPNSCCHSCIQPLHVQMLTSALSSVTVVIAVILLDLLRNVYSFVCVCKRHLIKWHTNAALRIYWLLIPSCFYAP